jgi:hypothetical protein
MNAPVQLDRLRRAALVAGGVGLIACVAGSVLWPDAFYPAWLQAFLFWLGIALGAHAIILLHNLTGGAWGLSVHRVLDAATRTLPLVALAFLPLIAGRGHLYPWADAARVAHDPVLQHRAPWLNTPFWILRAAIYFAIWIGLSSLVYRWGGELERRFVASRERTMRTLSAIGVAVFGLTVTAAMVDWIMSLDARWYSTMFGALFLTAQGLSALAFSVIVTLLLVRSGAVPASPPGVRNDLGNLLLAFVMVWTYMAFSQFLIIWSGNLPEEITWYDDRMRGGWRAVAIGILAFQFALPFLLLLQRRVKRRATLLLAIAATILAARLLDLLWVVNPAFSPGRFHVSPFNLVAPIALGGLWLFVFIGALQRRPLAPRAVPEPHHGGQPGDITAEQVP